MFGRYHTGMGPGSIGIDHAYVIVNVIPNGLVINNFFIVIEVVVEGIADGMSLCSVFVNHRHQQPTKGVPCKPQKNVVSCQ